MQSTLPHPTGALPFAAALLFGTLAAPAFAQGTAEQREACTPDAVKLCADTIPDVGRTTACMKRHEAELSPRCHAAFLGGPASRDRVARIAPAPERVAPAPDEDTDDLMPDNDTPDVTADTVNPSDVPRARGVIGGLCRDHTLDTSTCRLAGDALDLASQAEP